jgi:hypothetical protein
MIFLRDPEKRFVSGLNEYCRQNGLDINETWKRVNAGELVDRHFAPQMIWLMHLYRYYKGDVSVKPFSEIKAYCRVHMNSAKHKEYVDPVKDFIDMDRQLMKYTNRTVGLKKLVEEYKNVLS